MESTKQIKNFRTVGHFTIDFGKFLGSGKYGKVYNAFPEQQYDSGKRYACKVIELGSESTEVDDTQQKDKHLKQQLNKQNGTNTQNNHQEENKNKDSGKEDNIALEKIKLLTKKDSEQNYLKKQFSQEVDTLKLVDSKHVIKIIKAYQSKSRHYLITELCNGGDLSSLLSIRKQLPENQAQKILKQIVQGLMDMQTANVIHRDLKLANILLHFPQKDLLSLKKSERIEFIKGVNFCEEDFEIKITDFGFAKVVQPLDMIEIQNPLNLSPTHKLVRENTICGTPAYMPPNQFLDKNPNYSEKFDIWSLGAIYYELIIGNSPFIDKTQDKFRKRLKEGDYYFSEESNITIEGIHFISRCLQYSESNRASITDLYEQDYLRQKLSPSKQSNKKTLLSDSSTVASLSTQFTLPDPYHQQQKRSIGKIMEEEKSLIGGFNSKKSKRKGIKLNSRKQYTLESINLKMYEIKENNRNSQLLYKDAKLSMNNKVGSSGSLIKKEQNQNKYSAVFAQGKIKKSESFGNLRSQKLINQQKNKLDGRTLTLRGDNINSNQILFDSDNGASYVIVKSNNYEISLQKLLVIDYFSFK